MNFLDVNFKRNFFSYTLLSVFFMSGCSSITTLEERKTTLFTLSYDKAVVQKEIKTSLVTLFSMQKITTVCKNEDVKIYIEGDGLAWVTRSRISDDPTPLYPLAFSLMMRDTSPCKVYIARPCQYIKEKNCENKYWTSHRFNTNIIQSFGEALDSLKQTHKNSSFTLVGYSGGGAITALLASKRKDVSMLITVAGNIDTDVWVKKHGISPLDGSLNPADYAATLQNIPQHHLIGEDDTIIPKEIFFSYLSKFEHKEKVNHSLHKATHNSGWEESYTQFLLSYSSD